VALLAIIVAHEAHMTPRLRDTALALDRARIRTLVRIGLPAAGQMLFEVGVFALATALAGRVSADALAANQIALNMASLTFMVPYGIGSAGAVRVGQSIGRGDLRGARAAGWTAITLGVAFMSLASSVFLLFPAGLVHAYTADAGVLPIGVALLFVAAIFQL